MKFTEELKRQVEAASGGKQTVLCTAKGQASYMNVVPAFNLEELGPEFGTALHPAFLVGGVEKSEILIGTYQAVIIDGEALSLPEQDPAVNVDFDAARAACQAAGEGFHLTTNWEWAAVALQCAANGQEVRGNTSWGKSHAASTESGTIAKSGRTLTGSGPISWRHDGTENGVADLVGNIWEWVDGLKLVSGQFVVPLDNNIALSEKEWTVLETFVDGGRPLKLSQGVISRGWHNKTFSALSAAETIPAEIVATMKRALLLPASEKPLPGHFWADNSKNFEALPFRGGGWGGGSYAGLAALHLGCERSYAYSVLGFRPAFIR